MMMIKQAQEVYCSPISSISIPGTTAIATRKAYRCDEKLPPAHLHVSAESTIVRKICLLVNSDRDVPESENSPLKCYNIQIFDVAIC